MSINKQIVSAQTDALAAFKEKLNGAEIQDATNPVNLLLESSISMASDAYNHTIVRTKSLDPNLSTEYKDISKYLADRELINSFATPSRGIFTFYLSKQDIINFGKDISISGVPFKIVTIPKNTFIEVDSVTFTLLEKVNVFLDESGKSLVELTTDEHSLNLKALGNIPSVVAIEADDVERVIFKLPVEQVTYSMHEDSLDLVTEFQSEIPLTDRYYKSRITLTHLEAGVEKVVDVKQVLDTLVIEDEISAKLTITDDALGVDIPKIYNMYNSVSGRVKTEVYTTKGKLYLPLYKFTRPDFKVVLGEKTTEEEAAMGEVTISVGSDDVTTSGTFGKSDIELREGIINRTNGVIKVPVTEFDIAENARIRDFIINKELDVLPSRLYTASKTLPQEPFTGIPSIPTIFNSKLKVRKSDVATSDMNGITADNNADALTIRSKTLFRRDGYFIKPLTNAEVTAMGSLTQFELSKYVKDNEILYTPFMYVVSNEADTVYTQVYDVDVPILSNLELLNKNPNIADKVTINGYKVEKIDKGYKVTIKTLGANVAFTSNDLVLYVNFVTDNGTPIYYTVYNTSPGSDTFEFIVETKYSIKDGQLDIAVDNSDTTKASSTLISPTIKLTGKIEIYIQNKNVVVGGNNYNANDEVLAKFSINGVPAGVTIAKELLGYAFIEEVKHIWSATTTKYDSKVFARHTVDIPLLYTEDVYDKKNNCNFEIQNINGVNEVVPLYLHRKDDPVLDVNNNPVMKYKKGDIKVDAASNPILLKDTDILHELDIVTFEYALVLSGNKIYTDAVVDTNKQLRAWLFKDLTGLNKTLLEHTEIRFKSPIGFEPVKLSVDNDIISLPSRLNPTVTLTVNSDIFRDKYSEPFLIETIGKIIDKHLKNKVIVKKAIRDDILSSLDASAVGVDIKGIGPDDIDVLTIKSSTLFYLEKDISQNLDVVYKINIKTVKVY